MDDHMGASATWEADGVARKISEETSACVGDGHFNLSDPPDSTSKIRGVGEVEVKVRRRDG
jgi:hypothetical protein